MSESVGVMPEVDDLLARLEADLDHLAARTLDPSTDSADSILNPGIMNRCTDSEVLDTWQRLERLRRRLAPVEHVVIAEVSTRALAHSHGCRSTAALATALLHLHPAEAKARVDAAGALGPRRTLTGEPLPPIYPATAAAQACGDISERHARIVVTTIEKLPTEIRAELDRTAETLLLDVARQHHPGILASHASDLAHALDQDGKYNEDRHRRRTRGLTLHRRTDGSARLTGELTAECAEHLHTHLDALTKPKPKTKTSADAEAEAADIETGNADPATMGDGSNTHGTDSDGVGAASTGHASDDAASTDSSVGEGDGAADGATDTRTPTQRRHDALLDMLKLVERAELLPTSGGVSATIVLTMDADTYARTTHPAPGTHPGAGCCAQPRSYTGSGSYTGPRTYPGAHGSPRTGRARPHAGASGDNPATDLDSDLADLADIDSDLADLNSRDTDNNTDTNPDNDPADRDLFAGLDPGLDLGDLSGFDDLDGQLDLRDLGDLSDLSDLGDLGDLGDLREPAVLDSLAAARRGCATTGHGYAIPADIAKQWAGPEARIIAVLLNKTRGIEAYSTIQRLFTEPQRLVLIARDLGCSFPGCDAPPQYCEAHHITEFRYSGRTCVDDATLLCSFHHRNFEAMGWTCTMINSRPHWTPPRWLDPTQTPQLSLRQRR